MPGSGAYVLSEAESIRDVLQPIGPLVFSPVPRGWINDTLKDGEIALNQMIHFLRL